MEIEHREYDEYSWDERDCLWLLLSEVIVNKGIDVRDLFLPNSPV